MTACIRSRSPSLVSRFETWVLIVPPVACFADHVDVVLGFEDHLEAGSDQRLIVDQHDRDGHTAPRFKGR
jgi:hypothetical protein